MIGTWIRLPRSILLLSIVVAGCEAADPLEGMSPFATLGCGGYYLALADDPATPAPDKQYYEALAEGLVTATTAFSPASRSEVTTEMQRWRDEWKGEMQSDFARSPEGRAETANFLSECASLTARLPETRNIQRPG